MKVDVLHAGVASADVANQKEQPLPLNQRIAVDRAWATAGPQVSEELVARGKGDVANRAGQDGIGGARDGGPAPYIGSAELKCVPQQALRVGEAETTYRAATAWAIHGACGCARQGIERIGPLIVVNPSGRGARTAGEKCLAHASQDELDRTPYAESAWREPNEPSRNRRRACHSLLGGVSSAGGQPYSGGAPTCRTSTMTRPRRLVCSSTHHACRWLPHRVKCMSPFGASTVSADDKKWPTRAVCRRACSSVRSRPARPK
eukprot:scaffold11746_cov109-Isochrysis_galbana.AAC.3